MDLDLEGRHFFVTGASGGVGLATVVSLLREGAQVTGCARDPMSTFESWEAAESRRREILMGRFGTVWEAADVITFLLSSRAGYITGTSIDIAGGCHGRP